MYNQHNHTTVKKSSSGELSTTGFKKETDCQTFLHRKLEHPESLNIPYAQKPRLQSQLLHFVEKLIDRGYQKAEIYDSISKHLTETGK